MCHFLNHAVLIMHHDETFLFLQCLFGTLWQHQLNILLLSWLSGGHIAASTLSLTPFRCLYWNVPKPTIRCSHPLHTVIMEGCGGEKRVRVSLKLLFNVESAIHEYLPREAVWKCAGLFEWSMRLPPVKISFSLWCLWCPLEQLQTNFPYSMVRQCVVWTNSFIA